MKSKQTLQLTINQDGKVYDLYNLPQGFVIKGNLDLAGKGLTELPDLSTVTVCGEFSCSYNKLTNLKGAPNIIVGSFDCRHNELISLKGGPKKVNGGFYCHFNNLTSLKGAPRKIGGCVNFSYNKVCSFQYLPRLGSGQVWFCGNNPLKVDDNVPKHLLNNLDKLYGDTESVRAELIKKYRTLTK